MPAERLQLRVAHSSSRAQGSPIAASGAQVPSVRHFLPFGQPQLSHGGFATAAQGTGLPWTQA
jgi:hypothetical protein